MRRPIAWLTQPDPLDDQLAAERADQQTSRGGAAVTTYYKAVRPDGMSFYDAGFRWVPETGPVEGVVTLPSADGDTWPGGDASQYLSVSAVPTDCTGMWWPCRLLVVEPVEGYPVATPQPRRPRRRLRFQRPPLPTRLRPPRPRRPHRSPKFPRFPNRSSPSG